MSTPEVVTLGCRLNGYESEVMRHHAEAAGLHGTVVVNTCAVTSEAVRQAEQTIRRARRDNPAARIIVTGCAAQIEPERFAAMTEVDHVVGNGEKTASGTFALIASGDAPRRMVAPIADARIGATAPLDALAGRTRAFVEIQNGCDHRCTFCIIPYGRGPSRSVAPTEVVARVRRLVAAGYAEVVLSGVDITDYGRGLGDGWRLGRLVRHLLREVPELRRLRLSSIDSIEADADLLAAIAEEERLMSHLHLSLQAGSDLILKRMKRRHSRSDAVRFAAEARRLRPGIALGADLIAGFPTETEDHFRATLDLVDDCGLAFVHAFPFSPRPGTPAARMPQLPRPEIKARADRLRTRAAKALERHLDGWRGRQADVLVESGGRGRTGDYTEVSLEGEATQGTVIEAVMHGHDGRRLRGEVHA